MSLQDGQQPELHAQLDRADAERAAGHAASEIWHSLCFTPHERGQSAFAAVGQCTVMYGMYGKMGSGVSPQNTVHYRTYRTPARTFPAPAGGGKCPLEGVQRERLAHDFGTKSSVLYPSRRGTGKLRGDAVPRAALTGPKKKNVRCRYRHLTDALFQKVVVGILRSLVSKIRQRRNRGGLCHFTICQA